MAHLQDPKMPDMADASRREKVKERIWNEPQKRWLERDTVVVLADAFFEKGAMRAAFKMKFVGDDVRGDRFYVAKLALREKDRRQEQVSTLALFASRARAVAHCVPAVRKRLQNADDCSGVRQGIQQAGPAQGRRVS